MQDAGDKAGDEAGDETSEAGNDSGDEAELASLTRRGMEPASKKTLEDLVAARTASKKSGEQERRASAASKTGSHERVQRLSGCAEKLKVKMINRQQGA